MIDDLDTVVLTRDLEECGLERGDVGAVVHYYPDSDEYEIEFVTGEGNTAALLTLNETDIRPIGKDEILHARGFIAA